MTHVGGQRRQPRLHVGAGAVPEKQGMECEGEAQVVDSWQTAVGGANAGRPEQVPHQHAKPIARIGCETAALRWSSSGESAPCGKPGRRRTSK